MAALDPPPRPSQSLDAHQIIIPAPEQQRQPSRSSASSSSHHTMRGKDHDRSRPKANSDASRGTRTSSSAHSGHIGEGKVRSLPRTYICSLLYRNALTKCSLDRLFRGRRRSDSTCQTCLPPTFCSQSSIRCSASLCASSSDQENFPGWLHR